MEKDKNVIGKSFGDEEIWDYIPTETDYNAHPEKIGSVNWQNGKPVLSFSSLCDKTKSIFTSVKGVPINVTEQNGDNYIYKRENEYTINISKKVTAGINRYTAFNHELGHYAFDSFNNQFGLHINEELKDIPMEHHDKAIEIYRTVFNILEDQRVESLMGKIYLGTGKRFKQSRKRLGQMKPESHKTKDPLDALHCAREFREDSITRRFKEAENVMDKIALKDSEASIILAKHYIKTVVNPWLRTQLKNFDKKATTQQSMKEDPNKPITATPKFNKAFKNAFVENRKCDHRELSDTDELDSLEDTKKRVEASKLSMEDVLKASQNNAKGKISAIKDKIEQEARKAKVSSAVLNKAVREYFGDEVNESFTNINPDMRVAQQLNKIFKLLQANQKPKLSDTGDSLSIPAVIRRMARGYGDIHVKQSPKDSLSILVSIDASGSMSGREITIARDMMSTLYKSIHGINNIELKGVVWSGSEYHTAVCEVRNIKETQRIVCSGVFGGGTPTPAGVEYSERKLEEMKGKKKLLIVITDGYPNSYSNSNLTPEQMVRKEINRAKKKGIMTMGIGVGISGNDRKSDPMNVMFGHNGYITTYDMQDTQNIVIKKFRDIIIKQMRR